MSTFEQSTCLVTIFILHEEISFASIIIKTTEAFYPNHQPCLVESTA